VADPSPAPASPGTIAVVIATCRHDGGIVRAAASVLASCYRALQLTVVDQSGSTEVARALRHLAGDPRLQVLRAPDRGLAAARNVGVAASSAPIIAFTDDDCEVDAGWLDGVAAAFAHDTRIGVVFGAVPAAPYDRGAGFIPAYSVPRPFTARGVEDKAHVEGIGACMAVRRSAWEQLGGFDEQYGAGAPLRAGEDSDFAMRALIAGRWVHETPDAVVRHRGFRTWSEGPGLIEGYMYGLGAANAKMLRMGGVRALIPIAQLAWRWLAGSPVVDLNHRPPQFARLRPFLRGAWLALRTPLDRETGRLMPGPRLDDQ
jgi:GT2 family glycosyltransferase